jgi:polar amino acid transport system permease protein
MAELVQNFGNIDVLYLTSGVLLRGLMTTVILAVFVIPLGMISGLLVSVALTCKAKAVRWLLFCWIDIFRAFPPLVLLIYVYYGGPMLGIDLGAYGSIALAFTLNTSSYFCEIFRAGIESVPRGQWDAARSSGMNWPTAFTIVVLPQAVRTVLPDVISNVLTVTQLTSLASVVGVSELLRAALASQGTTYNATPLIAAALMYLVLLWPVVRLISVVERRMRGPTGLGVIALHP